MLNYNELQMNCKWSLQFKKLVSLLNEVIIKIRKIVAFVLYKFAHRFNFKHM
jgi:hypothetical protein